jgi:hypothetical protein
MTHLPLTRVKISSELVCAALNARSTLGLDNARQLEAEIVLPGLRHGPILRHRNLSERYHTHHGASSFAPQGALSTAFAHALALPTGLSSSVQSLRRGNPHDKPMAASNWASDDVIAGMLMWPGLSCYSQPLRKIGYFFTALSANRGKEQINNELTSAYRAIFSWSS